MNLLRYAIPTFLILFTLGSLYVFFLGRNGLASYEEKKKRLFDLQNSTELFRKRIKIVQQKRENLEKNGRVCLRRVSSAEVAEKGG